SKPTDTAWTRSSRPHSNGWTRRCCEESCQLLLIWSYSRQDLLSRFVFPAVLVLAMAARANADDRGQLDASPTLFTVMAAINAAGYDAELASPNNHPLRKG